MIRHRRPRARSCDLPFSIHFCQTFSSSSMVSTCARSMRSLLGVGFLPAKKSGQVAYLIRHSLFSAESGAPGFGPLRGENQPKYGTKAGPARVKNGMARRRGRQCASTFLICPRQADVVLSESTKSDLLAFSPHR